MRLFDRDIILGAIHGPYCDMYWTRREELGDSAGPGAELCDITPMHPDTDRLLSIAHYWLGQISQAWQVDAWLVLYHLDQELGRETDKEEMLFLLFMECLGHWISLDDDHDVFLALQRVSDKLGKPLAHRPAHFCDDELGALAEEAANNAHNAKKPRLVTVGTPTESEQSDFDEANVPEQRDGGMI